MWMENTIRTFLLATAIMLVSSPSYAQFDVVSGDNPELDACFREAADGANTFYQLYERVKLSVSTAIDRTYVAELRNILSEEWAEGVGPEPEGEDRDEWIEGMRDAELEAAGARRNAALLNVHNQFLRDIGIVQDSFNRNV